MYGVGLIWPPKIQFIISKQNVLQLQIDEWTCKNLKFNGLWCIPSLKYRILKLKLRQNIEFG